MDTATLTTTVAQTAKKLYGYQESDIAPVKLDKGFLPQMIDKKSGVNP